MAKRAAKRAARAGLGRGGRKMRPSARPSAPRTRGAARPSRPTPPPRAARRAEAPRAARARPAPPPLRIVEGTRWRDARGRFAAAPKRGVTAAARRAGWERERYQAQIDARGKILRIIGATSKRRIIKTVLPGVVEAPGPQQGSLFWAMAKTNILTSAKGATRLVLTITGRDREGRRHRIKVDVQPREKRLADLLVGAVSQALREAGYRPQYTLEVVRERMRRGKLQTIRRPGPTGRPVNVNALTAIRAREVLTDLAIHAVIER